MTTILEHRTAIYNILKATLPAWQIRFEGEDLADRAPNAVISIISDTPYTHLGYTEEGARLEFSVSLWVPSRMSEALQAENASTLALLQNGYRRSYTTSLVDPEKWYGVVCRYYAIYPKGVC